jgi:hypothetical protein
MITSQNQLYSEEVKKCKAQKNFAPLQNLAIRSRGDKFGDV